jgi:hypothetical protein
MPVRLKIPRFKTLIVICGVTLVLLFSLQRNPTTTADASFSDIIQQGGTHSAQTDNSQTMETHQDPVIPSPSKEILEEPETVTPSRPSVIIEEPIVSPRPPKELVYCCKSIYFYFLKDLNGHYGTSQDLKFVFDILHLPTFSEFNPRLVSEYGMYDKDAKKINEHGLSEFFCNLFDVVIVGDTNPGFLPSFLISRCTIPFEIFA